MAANKYKALKYVSATSNKRLGRSTSTKKTKTKGTKTRKVDNEMYNAIQLPTNDELGTVNEMIAETIKPSKAKRTKATKQAEPKGTLIKPDRVEKSWFVIAMDGKVGRTVANGTQLDCLQYISSYAASNSEANTILFLANGFKVTGY